MTLASLRGDKIQAVAWRMSTEQELAALFEPEVIQWLPPVFQGHTDDAARRSFLSGLEQDAEICALSQPEHGVIGLLILSHSQAEQPERHLGYLFAKKAWGQGLGSDLIMALTDHFSTRPVVLVGGVAAQNPASARVLEKASFDGQRTGPHWTYRWQSPALDDSDNKPINGPVE